MAQPDGEERYRPAPPPPEPVPQLRPPGYSIRPAPDVRPGALYPPPRLPERADVSSAARLLVLAGLAVAAGCYLRWFTVDEGTRKIAYNGFTQLPGGAIKDGPLFFVLGVAMAALGMVLLLARRLVDMAILAVVVGGVLFWRAISDINDISDAVAKSPTPTAVVRQGPGLYVIVAGGVFGIAGGLVALAQRSRR